MRPPIVCAALAVLALGLATAPLCAQENYEIQVYPSETMAPGRTMVELHSNYTFSGPKETEPGVRSSVHTFHETIEITEGWTPWFETGFYIFTSVSGPYGWQWVGDHIRPRVRVPESWHWPVGVSLSAEIGYQRAVYSADTWTLELRPIVDKEIGRWYLSFNPTVERALRGPGVSRGYVFSPNFKVGYDFSKRVNGGLEYYGSVGPLGDFDPSREQQHQLGPALDFNLGPDWELNVGAIFGLTSSTEHAIFKVILGRRFGRGRGESEGPAGLR